jgi:hypothetical protein
MSLTTRFGLVAGTTALAIAGSAFGGAESDNDALAQIAELKRELAELKQAEGQDWLTEQRASEIRGIVQDVLADADTRTSFQSSGAMAGWNKGFFLASPDGNFKLNVTGFMQVRWTANHANGDNATSTNGNNYEWGWENANTYLDFSGNVVDPSWTYHIRGNFANGASGVMGLTFASVTKDLGNGMGVTVGQFRGPWLRETLVDDPYQLGVDRSIMNSYFTQDFNQGLQFNYESDAFRANAYIGDGIVAANGTVPGGAAFVNSANTPWNGTQTNYAIAARGEYKISGNWADFDNFTSFRGEEGGMMVGAAAFYERGNQNAGAGLDGVKGYGLTADFSWEMGGANLFASFVWTGADGDNINNANPWGLNIQGGYFVTDDIEVFGRYDLLDYDLAVSSDTSKYNGFTVGANYFFSANVKATVEWATNFKSFGNNNYSQGFRMDNAGEKNQWALRAQLQLMF